MDTYAQGNPSKSKTEEFAKLFDLFDTLVERRSRVVFNDRPGPPLGSHPIPEDEHEEKDDVSTLELLNTLPIPREFQPIFHNLSSLVDARLPSLEASRTSSAGKRPRSQTVSTTTPSQSLLNSEYYPFTFKMMLHKLYETEAWGEKVKDMLEKSRSAWKSLEELKAEMTVPDVGENMSRPQSSTTAIASTPNTSMYRRGSVPIIPTIFEPPQTQPIKKRCVGRRVSLSTLQNPSNDIPEDGGRLLMRKEWVYESAVVQPPVSPRLGKMRPAAGLRSPGMPRRRSRYPSLGASQGIGPSHPTTSPATSGSGHGARRASVGNNVGVAPRRRANSTAPTPRMGLQMYVPPAHMTGTTDTNTNPLKRGRGV